MTIDEMVDILCQFPGDTPVIILPGYEEGGRKMWRTLNVAQINNGDRQPVFIGITTDGGPPQIDPLAPDATYDPLDPGYGMKGL
jgi:hypothetical protein